ncbi:four helix bundle protein [Flavobacterium sp. NRK F7]|uniref:four helix bundle protein n=1 Tax=Flavobacterium sp. NRK F7 TaxID=2954930 RepID=UPI00209101B1|nr:four helix bundle protein [Flavobacterium sp. NRK F7]MCO6162739.1 four helix bundle protein [Flavobacterium sp. NRK F7]
MSEKDLKTRTKSFTLSILDIVEEITPTISSKVIIYQISKSGTSLGANYRASCRARSDKEFLSKMNIVLEETDETLFWLEIIQERNLIKNDKIKKAILEANELVSIFVTIIKNTRKRIENENQKKV